MESAKPNSHSNVAISNDPMYLQPSLPWDTTNGVGLRRTVVSRVVHPSVCRLHQRRLCDEDCAVYRCSKQSAATLERSRVSNYRYLLADCLCAVSGGVRTGRQSTAAARWRRVT